MENFIISGIQQIGIGIPDVHHAWQWYRRHFGMDIPVFEDEGIADLMLPYTGNQPQKRHAILAINPQGGSGFEVWQYKSRVPQNAEFELKLGDYGIFIGKMKTKNAKVAYEIMKLRELELLGEVTQTPDGRNHFFVKDLYGNIFEVEDFDDWFTDNVKMLVGGPVGAAIGVSDMDKAKVFYNEILGYDKEVYDTEGTFDDLKPLPAGDKKVRRVLLTHSKPRQGAFSPMLGHSHIELVQALERDDVQKIYANRFWGDLGFIHLCFDISGMDALKQHCTTKGYPFTVDSAQSFDMGEAAGHFTYTEDPDGTLIEFVETYKVPIHKQFGWFIDLKKREPHKPLPKLLLRALALNRVKD